MRIKSKNKIPILIAILLGVSTIGVTAYGYISNRDREAKSTKVLLAEMKEDSKKEAEFKEKVKTVGKGHTLNYVPMGDSLTGGFFASVKEKAFVYQLGNLLHDNMSFDINKGISSNPINNNHFGSILSGALDPKNLSQVNNQNPDLITIEYGTNDCNPQTKIKPEDFKNQLNDLIDSVSIKVNKNPLIVLLTTWNQGENGDEFDTVIEEVGKERRLPVVNLKTIYTNSNNKGPQGKDTFLGKSDNFHPNDDGMAAIAQAVFDEIQSSLYERYKTK